MLRLKWIPFCACAVFALASYSHASIQVDNTGTDGGNFRPFGAPNSATYGQTFRAGADNILDSFSLFLRGRISGSGTLDLRGYIGAWDGDKISSILYTSATQTMNAAGTLQEFAFSPNLALTTGLDYVAFLSISELPPQPESSFGMPRSVGNTITPGEFVFLNNGTDFSLLSQIPWNNFFVQDVWFKASFSSDSVVPEPSAIAIWLVMGVAAAGCCASRQLTYGTDTASTCS